MSQDDRERWDRRHAQAGPAPDPEPPRAFAHVAGFFPTGGEALDVACGRGTGTVWLAARGLRVLGVDVSPVAVEHARDLAARCGLAGRCTFAVADLDGGLPAGPPVDLLLCHMFRDARLDRPMVERVRPGGLLAVASRSEVGAGPGRFRARPGELHEAFAPLDVLAGAEGDGVAWLIARKPATPRHSGAHACTSAPARTAIAAPARPGSSSHGRCPLPATIRSAASGIVPVTRVATPPAPDVSWAPHRT